MGSRLLISKGDAKDIPSSAVSPSVFLTLMHFFVNEKTCCDKSTIFSRMQPEAVAGAVDSCQ
ncbi:hypothetical protein CR492_00560 [Methylocella silvestris]|uniref:Uncharacterized protein n=1 Tax=Methylocella silvestris TaxID=199596 RepID=A0A2J7TL31_METSI|nr:hypothetical protein CR492_00560 [Methylocella silvestris]